MDLKPLLREADLRAERVVAIIRLVIALVLGSVFALTVLRTLPSEQFARLGGTANDVLARQTWLALFTIVAYVVLGLGTLVLSLARRYRPWMAWPFATADVIVALASVYFGLRNTGLIGAYAPLLPSTGLLAIVLALGTLRYRPALQVYIAGLAVVGLAAVTQVTDGFVWSSYFEGRDEDAEVLLVLPPTVMRIIILAVMGVVLTLAVWRATIMLRRATEAALRQTNLARYLPPEVADMLSESDIGTLRTGRRARVTVLFVDIRSFTTMSEEMDPRDLSTFMTQYRGIVSTEAERFGGVVDKFIGDGAMIVFGMNESELNDASQGVQCARAIDLALRRWGASGSRAAEPIETAMGLHSGIAFCGAIGDDHRLEFTVLGDVVNTASRLEFIAKRENAAIAVSSETFERAALDDAALDAAAVWRPLGEQLLRGRKQPLSVLVLDPPAK